MVINLDIKKIRQIALGFTVVAILVVGLYFGITNITKGENPEAQKKDILGDAFTKYREVATDFKSVEIEVKIDGEFAQLTQIDSENKILFTKNTDFEIYVTEDKSYALSEGEWYLVDEEGNDYESVKEIALQSNSNTVQVLLEEIDYDQVKYIESTKCADQNCYKFEYTRDEGFPITMQVTKNTRELRFVDYQIESGQQIDVAIDNSVEIEIPQEVLQTTKSLDEISSNQEEE